MATLGTANTPYVMTDPPSAVSGEESSAVTIEGTHTEPTIGQIWPR